MYSVWQGLLANLAIVASIVAAWTSLREFVGRFGERIEGIAFGLVMGGGAALAMTLAFQLQPGMIFDLRTAPLAVAGFFGGPLAALIALVPALLFRVTIGGSGMFIGCMNMTAVMAFALLLNAYKGRRTVRGSDILLLAVGCALTNLLSFFALPIIVLKATLLPIGLPSCLLNVVGVALAGLSLFRDERRRELVAADALHRAVIEALPDCLNVKDLDGRFMAANPATADLMRAERAEDLIGKSDFDFYPAETARLFREEELAIQAADREATIEQKAQFPDGSTVWLSTLKAPLRDRDGRLLGMITHNRNITKQKTLSIELQRTRHQLTEALEHMADGLVMYDGEGRILLCNQRLRALFPITADLQVPGSHLSDILRASLDRGEQRLPDGVDADSWVESMLAEARSSSNRLIPMADGRFLAARDRPMADVGFLTVFSDVTAETMRERDLEQRAERDPLTELHNRSAFNARLAELHQAAVSGGADFSVMLMDLDHFKQVNDSFGHAVGDQLLVEVARRLEATCRQSDLVARLGGDEFALLAMGGPTEDGMMILAQRVLDNVCRPVNAGSVTMLPTCSIGVTTFSKDPTGPEALLLHADEALYAAKARGRRNWMAYGNRPYPEPLDSKATATRS